MAIGIRGFAAIIAVAALMVIGVACENGAEPTSLNEEAPTQALPTVGGKTQAAPIVSHGGPIKDYVSLVDILRAAGATVDPAGTVSASFLAPESQWLTVNGEDIQAFEFASAEEAGAAAGGVSANGLSIVTTMADGVRKVTTVDWVFAPPHYYKTGKLIVLYVGSDNDVIDALQDAMGPQFAGGEAPTPAPGVQPVPAGMGMIAPNLRLTFDGVEYTGVEIVGAASPTGPIVCCGTPIDMDDMEVVGTGTRNNPDGDASVELYRPKAGATTDPSRYAQRHYVYTFHPAQTPATWTRWTDDPAPLAPAALPVPGATGMVAPDLRLTFEGWSTPE